MPNTESVAFNGIIFRRYPDSPNRSERVYYSPSTTHRQNGVGRLHQEIWKAANGPIPDGYHVHHLDGDPLNNDLANLGCLPAVEHLRHHNSTPERIAHLREIQKQAILVAPEWHRSEAGRAWHSEHGRKSWINREPQVHTCAWCGDEYQTLKLHDALFCSNNCKSSWRRASGIDNEQRVCPWCDTEFTTNRYSPKRCCGRSCAAALRHAAARGRLQPDS